MRYNFNFQLKSPFPSLKNKKRNGPNHDCNFYPSVYCITLLCELRRMLLIFLVKFIRNSDMIEE